MAVHSFSRFLYCDTNILSHLGRNRTLWPRLGTYLLEHGLSLAIGSQVAELADVPRLHEPLARLFVSVPSGIIKSPDVVLSEEVAAYPGQRNDTLLAYPLNALLVQPDGPQQVQAFLSSGALREAREGQRRAAEQLAVRHAELKRNFPPAGLGGRYTRDQAAEFAWMLVTQWLADSHLGFLRQFRSNAAAFSERPFRSIRLFALVLFYKYYLGGRDPRRRSDFGDLSHLCAIPYCTEAIMERDLANVFRQIQRHDDLLASTSIYDIDFMSNWAVKNGASGS